MLDSERWELEQKRRRLDRLTVWDRHHRALYGQPTAKRQAAPATTTRRRRLPTLQPQGARAGRTTAKTAARELARTNAQTTALTMRSLKQAGRLTAKAARLMRQSVKRDLARAEGRELRGPVERVTFAAGLDVGEDGTIKGVLR